MLSIRESKKTDTEDKSIKRKWDNEYANDHTRKQAEAGGFVVVTKEYSPPYSRNHQHHGQGYPDGQIREERTQREGHQVQRQHKTEQ